MIKEKIQSGKTYLGIELGIGDASGMFPIKDGDYDNDMLDKFDKLIEAKGFDEYMKSYKAGLDAERELDRI